MRRITTFEHSRLPIYSSGFPENGITVQEAHWLYSWEEKRRAAGASPVFEWEYAKALKTRDQIGVIQLPTLTLEILPKISQEETVQEQLNTQRALLTMLHLTQTIPPGFPSLAPLLTVNFSFLEVLTLLFAEGLLQNLQQGIPHDFVREEQPLPFVRGRLLISRQILSNPGQPLPLWNTYPAYITDTPANRLLKCASQKLVTAATHEHTRTLLRQVLHLLETIPTVSPREAIAYPIPSTPRYQSLQPYLTFSRWVLQQQTPAFQQGTAVSFSLLFSMPELFESFVTQLLHRYQASLGLSNASLHPQPREHALLYYQKTRQTSHQLQPDLIIREEARVRVLDTKWKRLSKPVPSREDLYQMAAYALAYSNAELLLVYPATRTIQGIHPAVLQPTQQPLTLVFLPLHTLADSPHTLLPLFKEAFTTKKPDS